jgi:probable F420-dependent oxidoreductase
MAVDVGRVGVWSGSSLWEGGQGGEVAAELDELGFGALWLGSAKGDLNLVEGLLGATKRLVLATGIVNIWTEPAETTAAAYHRVAAEFPGRLLLGIGAGHKKFVEPLTGQQYVRPYQRLVAYLDELDAANVSPQDRAVAALGPKVLALAGQRSAGAHPYLVTPEHTAQAREILGDGPLLAPEQKVILETDPDKARAIARATLELYLGLPNYTNNWLRLGYTEDDLADGGSDRLVDGLVAWGDVDTVLTRISQHHQAGADHVCIQVLTDEPGLPRKHFRILADALFG